MNIPQEVTCVVSGMEYTVVRGTLIVRLLDYNKCLLLGKVAATARTMNIHSFYVEPGMQT